MASAASFGGVEARRAGWFSRSVRSLFQWRASVVRQTKHMSNKFLQISQVSDLLEISETTARRLVKKGVLPAIRVGRQIRAQSLHDDFAGFRSPGDLGNDRPSIGEEGRAAGDSRRAPNPRRWATIAGTARRRRRRDNQTAVGLSRGLTRGTGV